MPPEEIIWREHEILTRLGKARPECPPRLAGARNLLMEENRKAGLLGAPPGADEAAHG